MENKSISHEKYITEGSNMHKSNKFSPFMVRLLFPVRALNNAGSLIVDSTTVCQDVSSESSDCLANA